MQAPASRDTDRHILLDVSRLIWRAWGRRLPTGIDRVCLAYLEHFKDRARAIVQRKGLRFVLSARDSDRLFQQILKGSSASRLDWVALGLGLFPAALRAAPVTDVIYLNIGHTGLDEPTLPDWVARNRLHAVYMVHDLIPVAHPQFCREGEAAKHARRLDNMLATASGIIGNSQATLTELEQYARSSGGTMPPTIAALIAGHAAKPASPPARPDRPYFVAVGTIEARKNHMLLLHVWRRLVSELGSAAPMLVIAGQRGWEAEATLAILDDLGELHDHVIELSRCDDDELAGWIAGARALLMPSFVEGFGLPIIEALQLSAPVIASNLPVYREIAAEIPVYLDPRDEAGWAAAIKDFMTDGLQRQRQLAAMRAYQAPSWRDHFNRIEPWLARVS